MRTHTPDNILAGWGHGRFSHLHQEEQAFNGHQHSDSPTAAFSATARRGRPGIGAGSLLCPADPGPGAGPSVCIGRRSAYCTRLSHRACHGSDADPAWQGTAARPDRFIWASTRTEADDQRPHRATADHSHDQQQTGTAGRDHRSDRPPGRRSGRPAGRRSGEFASRGELPGRQRSASHPIQFPAAILQARPTRF